MHQERHEIKIKRVMYALIVFYLDSLYKNIHLATGVTVYLRKIYILYMHCNIQ